MIYYLSTDEAILSPHKWGSLLDLFVPLFGLHVENLCVSVIKGQEEAYRTLSDCNTVSIYSVVVFSTLAPNLNDLQVTALMGPYYVFSF